MLSLFSGSTSLVGFAFCYLLPAYNSFKALRSGSRQAVIKLLMHWTVVSLYSGIEVFADMFISWLPFYSFTKFMFVLWLTLPQTQGAVFVYRYLIHTQFLKHEAKIDNLLAQAEASAWNYAYYLRAQAVTYGRQMLASSLDQGARMLQEYVQNPALLINTASSVYLQLQQASVSASAAAAAAASHPVSPIIEEIPTPAIASTFTINSQENSTDHVEDKDDDGFDADYVDEDEEEAEDEFVNELVKPASKHHHHDRRISARVQSAMTMRRKSLALSPSSAARRAALLSSANHTKAANSPVKPSNSAKPSSLVDFDAPFSDADIATELARSTSWSLIGSVSSFVAKEPLASSPLADENGLSTAAAAPSIATMRNSSMPVLSSGKPPKPFPSASAAKRPPLAAKTNTSTTIATTATTTQSSVAAGKRGVLNRRSSSLHKIGLGSATTNTAAAMGITVRK